MERLNGKDRDGARRAMQAMMEMTNLDLTAMRRAYEGKAQARACARREG